MKPPDRPEAHAEAIGHETSMIAPPPAASGLRDSANAGDPTEKPTTYYSNARREIFPLIPETASKLLDVGCADGTFGASLKQRRSRLRVWGIEVMPDVAARARINLDCVINSGIEEALVQLPDAEFDCITFNDCLEHLANPWDVLQSIRGKLAPDGCIVASIPNMRFYPVIRALVLKGEFEYTDAGILDRTHLRFFTASSMRSLFGAAGYRITTMKGIHRQRLPLWLRVVSRLARWRFHDMQFMQYALVAVPTHVERGSGAGPAERALHLPTA